MQWRTVSTDLLPHRTLWPTACCSYSEMRRCGSASAPPRESKPRAGLAVPHSVRRYGRSTASLNVRLRAAHWRPMSSRPDIPGSRFSSVWSAIRAWFGETDGLARSLSNGTWMLIERMLAMCSAIVVSVWVARYLGPREFGVLSYAVAFVALFTPLAALGINNILVKELVMDRERERV